MCYLLLICKFNFKFKAHYRSEWLLFDVRWENTSLFFTTIRYFWWENDFHIICCSWRLAVTRRVPSVNQELLTLRVKHLSSPPVLCVACVRSLVFNVLFCRSLFIIFSFCFPIVLHVFCFHHCIACLSNYPLGYLQTFIFHLLLSAFY